MKPICHPRTRRLLAAALAAPALLTAQHASAALVVDFGGDLYVDDPASGSTNVALQSAQGVFVDVGSPTTVSPDPNTTAYNGDSAGGTSSRFYGGYGIFTEATDGTTPRFLFASRFEGNSGVRDQIRFLTFPGGGGFANDLVFLQLFDNDDFLNGGDNSIVSLDSTSSFSAQASGQNNSSTRAMRFVVKQGGEFYISSDSTFANGGSTVTENFDDLTWFEYDPASSLLFDGGAAFTGTFDDVEALGVYATTGRPSTTGAELRLTLGEFSANATLTPIPEPSSLALLGLAGLTLLPRRRRD